jgi:hypothetical protein
MKVDRVAVVGRRLLFGLVAHSGIASAPTHVQTRGDNVRRQ